VLPVIERKSLCHEKMALFNLQLLLEVQDFWSTWVSVRLRKRKIFGGLHTINDSLLKMKKLLINFRADEEDCRRMNEQHKRN
jgi:hypothetical protein